MPPLVRAITAVLMSTTLAGKPAYQFIHVVASLCNFLLYPEKYMIKPSASDARRPRGSASTASPGHACPDASLRCVLSRRRRPRPPAGRGGVSQPELLYRGVAWVACSACRRRDDLSDAERHASASVAAKPVLVEQA